MERYILRGSYWLGIGFAALALIARIFNALGYEMVRFVTKGNEIDFRSFLDAALLFLFIAVASSGYISAKSQQHHS